ncbi:unnamed protein product [Prorocentrum cordatum]|uniref:Uncharacterized protein n=1 Tax=Prorocentrum cordatum TaxID=2364126 RepID=A0ABN9VV86_9DINO|nr:unnamed protein product [Polarella glacialis]
MAAGFGISKAGLGGLPDEAILGPTAARRAARRRCQQACEGALRSLLAAAVMPGSWQDRERAARPALRLAAAGARVPGSARRRRNAAWHAAVAPAAGRLALRGPAMPPSRRRRAAPGWAFLPLSTPPAAPRQVAPITPTTLRKEAPPWPEGWQAQKSEGKGHGDDDDGDETSEQAIDDAYRVLAEEGPEVQAPCDPDEEEGRSALPQRAAVVAFALPRSARAAVALQSGPEEVEEPVGKTEGEVMLSFGVEVPTACVAADVDGISCGLHGDESAVACQAAPCARIELRQAEIAFEVDFDGRVVIGALVTTAADSQGVPVRVYDLLEDGCVVVPSTRVRSRALPAAWVAAEAARLQRLGASQPFVHRLAAREREALADQHRLRWLLDAWWRMVPRECSSHGTALEEQLTRMNEVVCADDDFDGSFGMGVAQRPFEPQMAPPPPPPPPPPTSRPPPSSSTRGGGRRELTADERQGPAELEAYFIGYFNRHRCYDVWRSQHECQLRGWPHNLSSEPRLLAPSLFAVGAVFRSRVTLLEGCAGFQVFVSPLGAWS